jgi:hypothetical protein
MDCIEKQNIICSYPRSGNHLVRFFIELLSELPTSGCHNNPDDVPIYMNKFKNNIFFNIKDKEKIFFYKKHCMPPLQNIKNLIFLLRNPQEVLLRHHNYNIIINKSWDSFDEYFNNIDKYLEFDGKKMLFFYEDIISDKKVFIEQLYNSLEINNINKKKYVTDNIEFLYNESSQGEGRSWGGINSNFKVNYYYDNEKNINKKEFDVYLKNKLNIILS